VIHSETHADTRPLSRRAVLAGGIAAPFLPTPSSATSDVASDPILSLWAQWRQASAEAEILGTRCATLESELARTVGFPRVQLPMPGDRAVWATSRAEIDAMIVDRQGSEVLRSRLQAELSIRQAQWSEAAARAGVDASERQEAVAAARCAKLAECVFALPARSLPGVIVKLELILRMGQTRADDNDFPWGELRAAIVDLKRFTAELGIPSPLA
jgi:hypothetical protein